eukprot:263572-Hanusia_phi.AAC.1
MPGPAVAARPAPTRFGSRLPGQGTESPGPGFKSCPEILSQSWRCPGRAHCCVPQGGFTCHAPSEIKYSQRGS